MPERGFYKAIVGGKGGGGRWEGDNTPSTGMGSFQKNANKMLKSFYFSLHKEEVSLNIGLMEELIEGLCT